MGCSLRKNSAGCEGASMADLCHALGGGGRPARRASTEVEASQTVGLTWHVLRAMGKCCLSSSLSLRRRPMFVTSCVSGALAPCSLQAGNGPGKSLSPPPPPDDHHPSEALVVPVCPGIGPPGNTLPVVMSLMTFPSPQCSPHCPCPPWGWQETSWECFAWCGCP